MSALAGLLQAYTAAFLVGLGAGVVLKAAVNIVHWIGGADS